MMEIRWSNLTLGCNGNSSPSNMVGYDTVQSGTGTACRVVDEFVLDPGRGTVATLEAAPCFSALWNNGKNCSHHFPTYLIASPLNGNNATPV